MPGTSLQRYTRAKALPSWEVPQRLQPLPKASTLQPGSITNLARDLPSTALNGPHPTTARPLESLSPEPSKTVTPEWALMWLAESSRALHKGYKDKYKKYDGAMWAAETWLLFLQTFSATSKGFPLFWHFPLLKFWIIKLERNLRVGSTPPCFQRME